MGRASPITLESAELIVKIPPCFNFHPRKHNWRQKKDTARRTRPRRIGNSFPGSPWECRTPRSAWSAQAAGTLERPGRQHDRGGTGTRSQGPRGDAVLHALRGRRRRRDAGASRTATRPRRIGNSFPGSPWECRTPRSAWSAQCRDAGASRTATRPRRNGNSFPGSPRECRTPRSAWSAQCRDAGASRTAFPRKAWERDDFAGVGKRSPSKLAFPPVPLGISPPCKGGKVMGSPLGATNRLSRNNPATRHSPPATRHSPPATRHSPPATRHSPLATRHSPLATRHSPLATRHSPPATRHSPPATRHSPLATRHSPLATRHPPLATRHSPPATRHSPLATRHSPLATRHSPLATRHPPLATRHSPPVTRHPSLIDVHAMIPLTSLPATSVNL